MFRSATLRLSLWYLAIAMAISLLFSVALYNVTTNELRDGLHNESQSLYNHFPVFDNDPNFNFSPNSYYDDSSHRILVRLIGFNLIVLVGAGISSYLLARRTLEPIEAAHLQQKRFTSDVSHELRTPLTAIKMESEVALLSDKTSSKELRSTIQSNLEEVSKLESLINNLLKLSRLEVDELQHNFVSQKSTDITTSAVTKVSKIAENHGIKIKSTGKGGLISGDSDSLTQLLVIVLDNAIKYSPEKSTITIDNQTTKDNVVWSIKDEGVGIEKDALAHVFDRFYRSDNSRNKQKTEGYGLGLSIAKMISDIHSGNITLTSQVNKGTTVTLSLPKVVSVKEKKA